MVLSANEAVSGCPLPGGRQQQRRAPCGVRLRGSSVSRESSTLKCLLACRLRAGIFRARHRITPALACPATCAFQPEPYLTARPAGRGIKPLPVHGYSFVQAWRRRVSGAPESKGAGTVGGGLADRQLIRKTAKGTGNEWTATHARCRGRPRGQANLEETGRNTRWQEERARWHEERANPQPR